MTRPPQEEQKSQFDKFKEAAKRLETDDDEDRFRETVKRIVSGDLDKPQKRGKPEPEKPE